MSPEPTHSVHHWSIGFLLASLLVGVLAGVGVAHVAPDFVRVLAHPDNPYPTDPVPLPLIGATFACFVALPLGFIGFLAIELGWHLRRWRPFRITIRTVMIVTAGCAIFMWAGMTFDIGEMLGFVALLVAVGLHMGFAWIRVIEMDDDALR